MSESFELFVHSVKESVRAIGASFTKPDDDWAPVLIAETDEGRKILGIPVTFYQSKESKAILVHEFLPPFLRDAYRFAFITSTWQVKTKPDDSRAIRMASQNILSQHPGRYEAVVVNAADRERCEFWTAPILRDDRKPPALAAWERFDGATGLFIDPLVKALREVPE